MKLKEADVVFVPCQDQRHLSDVFDSKIRVATNLARILEEAHANGTESQEFLAATASEYDFAELEAGLALELLADHTLQHGCFPLAA